MPLDAVTGSVYGNRLWYTSLLQKLIQCRSQHTPESGNCTQNLFESVVEGRNLAQHKLDINPLLFGCLLRVTYAHNVVVTEPSWAYARENANETQGTSSEKKYNRDKRLPLVENAVERHDVEQVVLFT